LAAAQFAEADAHGAVVARGFLTDAPAQVNGLEAQAPRQAKLLEPRKDLALGLKVTERRADEQADGGAGSGHGEIRRLALSVLPYEESSMFGRPVRQMDPTVNDHKALHRRRRFKSAGFVFNMLSLCCVNVQQISAARPARLSRPQGSN
jgi:hypothetical protein